MSMANDFFEAHKWGHLEEVRWHFLILFDEQQQVHDMVEEYSSGLNHPGLHPRIPNQWLHITILAVGPIENISDKEMEEVVKLLRPKLASIDSPKLEVGPVWVSNGLPIAHVTPEEPVTEIFDVVKSATEKVLGDKLIKPEKFTPHMTLAYCRETNEVNQIRKQLHQKWIDPVQFTPKKLSLVKQRQVPPQYEWEIVSELIIGE